MLLLTHYVIQYIYIQFGSLNASSNYHSIILYTYALKTVNDSVNSKGIVSCKCMFKHLALSFSLINQFGLGWC